MQYLTFSEKETKNLARKLSGKIKSGIIALTGQLGAGKTTFVQGFAKGLGIKEKIISPTFVLIRQYKIPNSKKTLYHVDLYRIDNAAQIKQLGLKDLISDTNSIVLIEWAEKVKDILPKNVRWVSFENMGKNKRRVTIK